MLLFLPRYAHVWFNPTPKSVPHNTLCVCVCVFCVACTELKSDWTIGSRKTKSYETCTKEPVLNCLLPVACVYVCMCGSVPSENFVLHFCLSSHFRPIHDHTHLLLLLRYIRFGVASNTHGPSISTLSHTNSPYVWLPLTTVLRAMCVCSVCVNTGSLLLSFVFSSLGS